MSEEGGTGRRVPIGVAVGLAVALVVGAVLLLRPTSPAAQSGESGTTGYALVPVKREDLTISTSLDGKLGFGSTSAIPLQASGVVTWLPAAGSVIGRGQTLMRVDDQPIVLMYGTTPAFRAMDTTAASDGDADRAAASSTGDPAAGATDKGKNGKGSPPSVAPAPVLPMRGPDVEQLEQNLSAMGYGGFTVDDEFTSYTAEGVKAWQTASSMTPTGRVELGDVVFLPGPVRVSADRATLGTNDVSAAVEATSIEKVVTVTAPADSLAWANEGAPVSITLPDQKKAKGTVTSVGPGSGGEDGGNVSVRISLTDPGRAKEPGPVTVVHVSRREPNALTVPVTALVALAEGGYGVQLEDGSYVPVTPGIYAAGTVQITGELDAGAQVRDAR